jgi:hypothetical protein
LKNPILIKLLDEFIQSGVEDKLLEHLTRNSNLPGPRGNLELAASFANCLTDFKNTSVNKLWKLCRRMVSISVESAPVNSPKEFIPFCGTVGISSIAAEYSNYLNMALSSLQELSSDSRWRVREAVAMGLQRLISTHPEVVITELNTWINNANPLKLRAVVAGVAEPAILKNNDIATAAFQLNQKVVTRLIEINDRKTEVFRVLKKALAYTLSVVIVPLPKEGFKYLKHLIKINDPDVNWIVKENLKKNRLLKKFPDEVNSLKKLLN